MNTENSNDTCIPTGKERIDRAFHTRHIFDEFNIEVKNARTAILLLQSEEKDIFSAAAKGLLKYIEKSYDNVQHLFDLEILQYLMPLINHKDLIIQRFSIKLLANIVTVPSVRDLLLDRYLLSLTKSLIDEEQDTFVQESLCAILAKLSENAYGAAAIIKQCPSSVDLVLKMQVSWDSDVRKNCLEILKNLMQDVDGMQKIINSKNFQFHTICEHLQDETYPEIKLLALAIIRALLRRPGDEQMRKLFLESNGHKMLFNLLEDEPDLRVEILETLRIAFAHKEIAEAITETEDGISIIFSYLKEPLDRNLFLLALDVLVCLADVASLCEILYSHGIFDYFVKALKDDGNAQLHIREVACRGIMKILSVRSTRNCVLSHLDMVQILTNIMKDDRSNWSLREIVMITLATMFKHSSECCKDFIDIQGDQYLLKLLNRVKSERTSSLPVEVHSAALRMIMEIAKSYERHHITNIPFVEAICTSFKTHHDETKIATCEILLKLCNEKFYTAIFLEAQIVQKLYNLITDQHSIPVRRAGVELLEFLCKNPLLIKVILNTGFLSYMLKNRSSNKSIESWGSCIKKMINSHLPLKFAFAGEVRQHIPDGFYVTRRNINPFLLLNDFFQFKSRPTENIYIVNTTSTDKDVSEQKSSDDKEQVKEHIPQEIIFFMGGLDAHHELKLDRLPRDHELCRLIELFKCELKNRHFTIAVRAEKLAKFVARNMSGRCPTQECTEHRLDVHLKEIQSRIGTSVIPLGQIKIGSYFERALLFKVIADRTKIPAVLIRGKYDRAWVVITTYDCTTSYDEGLSDEDFSYEYPGYNYEDLSDEYPAYNYEDLSDDSFYSEDKLSTEDLSTTDEEDEFYDLPFPKYRLSRSRVPFSNLRFIVNLMNEPGSLMPIGSKEAKAYTKGK